MIKVTYVNEDSGQEAVFTVEPSGEESAKVGIKFDPSTGKDTEDPYGILSKMLVLFGLE